VPSHAWGARTASGACADEEEVLGGSRTGRFQSSNCPSKRPTWQASGRMCSSVPSSARIATFVTVRTFIPTKRDGGAER